MRTLTGNLGFGSMRNTSNTKLLLHCNGSDASTTITDSASGHTCVATGTAALETDYKKYGPTSLYVPTGTNYVSIADHADWNFGSGAWTIDFWFRPASDGATCGFFQQSQSGGYDSDNVFKFYILSNYLYLVHTTGTTTTIEAAFTYQSGGFPDTDWTHVALVRGWGSDTNKIACCINGVSLTEFYGGLGYFDATGITLADFTGPLLVGAHYTVGWLSAYGYIDEFRVVKGEAMWTTNFIPPAGPYS